MLPRRHGPCLLCAVSGQLPPCWAGFLTPPALPGPEPQEELRVTHHHGTHPAWAVGMATGLLAPPRAGTTVSGGQLVGGRGEVGTGHTGGGSAGPLGVSTQPVTWRRLVSERVAVRRTCRGAWSSLAYGSETGRLLAGDGMIIFTLMKASCF